MAFNVCGRRWLVAGLLASAIAPAWALPPGASAVEQQLAQERFTIEAPFPAGGPVDILARMLAEGLQKKYGQPALVENIPGAAGNLGMERAKRAVGKAHTLLVVPAGNLTINPTLMPQFPFNIEKDFTPITLLAKAPNVLVASVQSHIDSAKALVAQAKAKPGSLSFASPGVGSGLHLAGELFKLQTGTDLQHVPYKGTTPALNDVLGGVVPLMFSNLPAVLPHVRGGRLVALGVTDSVRSPQAPDIPTLAEQGIAGVVVTSWYGLLAPAGVSAPVAEQLARDVAEIFAQPAMRDRLVQQGLTAATQQPAEFAALIQRETRAWAQVIQVRHIVAD